jgi:hypothetical protein
MSTTRTSPAAAARARRGCGRELMRDLQQDGMWLTGLILSWPPSTAEA